jgi:hypothetical protein
MEHTPKNESTDAPQITAAHFGIKPKEYYVVSGEMIINAYRWLMAQRLGATSWLVKLPPTQGEDLKRYMQIYSEVNDLIVDLVSAEPLITVLEKMKDTQSRKTDMPPTKDPDTIASESLSKILARLHIDGKGKRDEMNNDEADDRLQPPSPVG